MHRKALSPKHAAIYYLKQASLITYLGMHAYTTRTRCVRAARRAAGLSQ